MAGPIRLQLSRRKGFDLQALSLKFNGLPAVNVSRPSLWGNPFTVTTKVAPGTSIACGTYIAVGTAEDAVDCYREMFSQPGERADLMRAQLADLRGKNLACWCSLAPGTPCHADVLIELANTLPERAPA